MRRPANLSFDHIRLSVAEINRQQNLEIHQYRRHIPKHFNTTDHFAGCIVDRRGGHLHGIPAAYPAGAKAVVDRPIGPVYQE